MSRVRMDTPFSMVPEWVIKAEISSHAKVLYAAVFRYANLPNGAMPGRKTLAEDWLHVSLDTLDRALRELITVGAIKRISRAGQANEYVLYANQGGRTRAATSGKADSRTRAQGDSRTRAARKKDSEREDSPVESGRGAGQGSEDGRVVPISAAPSRAARDALWDAMAAEFGEPATKSEKSNRGRQMRELLEAGFTSDELKTCVSAWNKKYPGATFTGNALVTHLGELRGPRRKRVAPCSECEMGGGHHQAGCSKSKAEEG